MQDCDNMSVVGAVAKGLSTRPPLSAALVSLSLACVKADCDLAVSHLAGCRNTEADALSRVNCPKVPDAPTDPAFWRRFTDGRKGKCLQVIYGGHGSCLRGSDPCVQHDLAGRGGCCCPRPGGAPGPFNSIIAQKDCSACSWAPLKSAPILRELKSLLFGFKRAAG